MTAIDFEVSVGSLSAKSGGKNGVFLLSLTSEIGAGAVGYAVLELRAGEGSPPKPGDAVTIKLGGETVFTGEALSINATPEALIIQAVDGLAKLERAHAAGAYKDKTAGAIAKDILEQAGVEAGTVDDGPKFDSYVLGRGPRAMRHITQIADQSGFIVFADGAGKIHFTAPKTGSAGATIDYIKQVLQIELAAAAPAFDGVIVWGEGAAGAKGADKSHWLVTSLSSVSGKASLGEGGSITPGSAGKRPLTVRDGAMRAAADAADQAKARMTALASRAVRGSIEILGDPARKPNELIRLEGIPQTHTLRPLAEGKALCVRRVRHTLTTSRGFITRMEL